MLTFNRDRNDNFISYSEGIEMISRSTSVPIYGSWDFYLGKGIIGGRITSGYLQGRAAAEMALKALNGTRAGDMAVLRKSPARYMFDYKYLEHNKVDMSALPDDAVIINRPQALYEKYKDQLISITFLSLTIALILLWKYIRQKSIIRAKQAVASELERSVRERTKSLEIANGKLERLSNVDGLTQLFNRRYFDKVLNREIKRLAGSSSYLSLIICDIDQFKQYNDAYGHLAGDDCIRAIASVMQQCSRRVSDIVARYGGEEFCVILPTTGPDAALALAESIRQGVESRAIPHCASTVADRVSISLGVTSIMPNEDTTIADIIMPADKALYESKKAGRNRSTLKIAECESATRTPGLPA